MKKLFAILLAVMLLMTAAASAETPSTFTFLDPVLVIDTGAGAQTFDLTGLQVKIAATESDPVKIRLSILGDGESLADITAQVSRVDGDQVHRL